MNNPQISCHAIGLFEKAKSLKLRKKFVELRRALKIVLNLRKRRTYSAKILEIVFAYTNVP